VNSLPRAREYNRLYISSIMEEMAVIHPETFSFIQKVKWSAFALFCALLGPWLVLRGLFMLNPEKMGLGPGLKRLWSDGPDAGTPNGKVLIFGTVLTFWSVLVTFAVVLPAWGAK